MSADASRPARSKEIGQSPEVIPVTKPMAGMARALSVQVTGIAKYLVVLGYGGSELCVVLLVM